MNIILTSCVNQILTVLTHFSYYIYNIKKGSAGGVFLCIKEHLDVSELDVTAEIIWTKVSISKRSNIYVCSFYDLSTYSIVQLDSSLNTLIHRSTNLPNIIVMEDFNLPSINWIDRSGQIIFHPSYGTDLNNFYS